MRAAAEPNRDSERDGSSLRTSELEVDPETGLCSVAQTRASWLCQEAVGTGTKSCWFHWLTSCFRAHTDSHCF